MDARQARAADAEAVAAFTADTWTEFEGGDYLPDVFAEWVATDGPDQHTVVAERDGAVAGCCQVVLLSGHEAWTQGLRVHPDHRGAGVARAMDAACRRWACERGAALVRNMVFSWNEQGLAAARSFGYRPRAEFRWVHPDPDDADPVDGDGKAAGEASEDGTAAAGDSPAVVTGDPDEVWGFWQRSDAREALGGLAFDRRLGVARLGEQPDPAVADLPADDPGPGEQEEGAVPDAGEEADDGAGDQPESSPETHRSGLRWPGT